MTIRLVRLALALLASVDNLPSQSPATLPLEGRWPTFDDLAKLRQIDEMSVSADGRWVAYVMAPVFDFTEPAPTGRIVCLSLRTNESHFINLPSSPYNLRWSPTGSLSFLMNTSARTVIWRYTPQEPATAPRPWIDAGSTGEEILDYAWNPAGNAIAYLASSPQENSATLKPDLVLFQDTPGNFTGPTTAIWERDTLGVHVSIASGGSRPHFRVVRRKVVSWKGNPRIEWLRTGELGVVGLPLNASAQQMFYERRVVIIDPGSGTIQSLVLDRDDAPRLPAWSRSGLRLAYLQHHKPSTDPRRPLINYAIHGVARDAGRARLLISKVVDGLWDGLSPLWSRDGRTLYIGRYVRGTARLYAVDVDTGAWRALTPDTSSVSHYALANDGKHLVVVVENANQPRELYRLNPVSLSLTRLTREGTALSHYPIARIEPTEWPSADRRFTIHGFLVKPPSYNPLRTYPLIVIVHGGPGAFYTNSFMDLRFKLYAPAQLLAAAGYLVLLPNPRGDSSYGPDFQAALNRDLAFGPFQDVDSGVSSLVERGLADSSSIGIYGHSYGGYLTAYSITQTRRYAAAAIDDGPVNLTSLFSQGYALGTMSLRFRLGGNPWTNWEAYTEQSPITFVNRVRTPVLMRYGGRSASTADAIRFSFLAQGLEFYAGLKENNVPVQFVLHPDQGHGIADWALYRDWTARTLTWFRQWLPCTGSD